jgi:transposase
MVATVQDKFHRLRSMMNEKLRRHWAACEAMALGRGGITAVSTATGLSHKTIRRGIGEIREAMPRLEEEMGGEHVRQPGGGRRRLVEKDATLQSDLQKLLESTTRGDPMCPLLWTCKSTRNLAKALNQKGHAVSHMTVARLLEEMEYHLQSNRKTKEGGCHSDRDA